MNVSSSFTSKASFVFARKAKTAITVIEITVLI